MNNKIEIILIVEFHGSVIIATLSARSTKVKV